MSDNLDIAPLLDRCKGQMDWLKTNHPECFADQKHLDSGSAERAYWHYGYMVSLRDALKFLTGQDPLTPNERRPSQWVSATS